ncbi:MAG: hypothetical protein AAF490_20665 [Chloroflexota bacterium]
MTIPIIVAVLFLITAVLHIFIPIRYGNNSTTAGIGGYGVIYLILGILLLATSLAWVPTTALVLTGIGVIGALTQINAMPELRNWTLLFIGIDIVIIILLLI